jgi:hypothetical protein
MLEEQLADVIEKAATTASGRPGQETSSALGRIAWYALFARDFSRALIAADRALGLAPDLIGVKINRAHALLFLNRVAEAKALYIAYKGSKVPQNSNKSWKQVVAEDFAEFRKAGLTHPAMSEIEAALGVAPGRRRHRLHK